MISLFDYLTKDNVLLFMKIIHINVTFCYSHLFHVCWSFIQTLFPVCLAVNVFCLLFGCCCCLCLLFLLHSSNWKKRMKWCKSWCVTSIWTWLQFVFSSAESKMWWWCTSLWDGNIQKFRWTFSNLVTNWRWQISSIIVMKTSNWEEATNKREKKHTHLQKHRKTSKC